MRARDHGHGRRLAPSPHSSHTDRRTDGQLRGPGRTTVTDSPCSDCRIPSAREGATIPEGSTRYRVWKLRNSQPSTLNPTVIITCDFKLHQLNLRLDYILTRWIRHIPRNSRVVNTDPWTTFVTSRILFCIFYTELTMICPYLYTYTITSR